MKHSIISTCLYNIKTETQIRLRSIIRFQQHLLFLITSSAVCRSSSFSMIDNLALQAQVLLHSRIRLPFSIGTDVRFNSRTHPPAKKLPVDNCSYMCTRPVFLHSMQKICPPPASGFSNLFHFLGRISQLVRVHDETSLP